MKYSREYWDDVQSVLRQIPHLNSVFGNSICITGATGMIGSAVADLLLNLRQSRQEDLTIFLAGRSKDRIQHRFIPFQEDKDYHFLYYDAVTGELDSSGIQCVDFIIHGAGNAHPAAYVQQPVETMLANLIGLNTLLQMAVQKKGKRLLYISSSEVYGRNERARPYHENDYGFVDLLNPRACYPSSKRAAETLCAAYSKECGLETVIVRPGHIYGPTMTDSDDRAVSQFIRNAVYGEPIVMKSDGAQIRSYCHSLDCASAILTILLNGKTGNAYNISNPNSIVSIRQIAEAIAREARTKIIFEKPSDSEKSGYNLMDNSALDSQKLEELGWSGWFNLELGIKHTLRAIKFATP